MKYDLQNFHLEAHKYIGVPFRHQGRTETGLDCIGLAVACAIDCGYDKIIEAPYAKEPGRTFLQMMVEKHLQGPMARPMQINDLVVARLHRGGPPVHAGIITHHPNGLGVIHTYGAVNRVVYHGLNQKLIDLIVAVYQWPESK